MLPDLPPFRGTSIPTIDSRDSKLLGLDVDWDPRIPVDPGSQTKPFGK